jgi:autotransporter family porin
VHYRSVKRIALSFALSIILTVASAFSPNATVAATVHFGTLSPHATLPAGVQCAQMVPKSSWEPRPENSRANAAIPSLAELVAFHLNPINFIAGPPATDFLTVDGNYTGTTDMIIRWAACKWGVDENVLRAQAYQESTWSSYTTGDYQTIASACSAGIWDGWQATGYCWQSYGITQAKMMSYNAWPMAWDSTSFNLDLRGAYWRACMNGDVAYYYDDVPTAGYPKYAQGTTTQMMWGCMGSWYSGSWYDSGALTYIADLQALVSSQPWRSLPSASSSSLKLLAPTSNQTISGVVPISITLNQTDTKACYACLAVDGIHQTCTPATGPFSWDTTNAVLNGHHEIQVDAFTCSGAGPNYHVGATVKVAN